VSSILPVHARQTLEKGLGRLLQGTTGKRPADRRIPGTLLPPGGNRQQQAVRHRRHQCHLLLQGLQGRRQKEKHDAHRGGVPTAVLPAHPAPPVRQNTLLRHTGDQAEKGRAALAGTEQQSEQKGGGGKEGGGGNGVPGSGTGPCPRDKDGTHRQAHRLRSLPMPVLPKGDHAHHTGAAKDQGTLRALPQSQPENLLLIPFPNARFRAGRGRVASIQRKSPESRESGWPGKTSFKKKGDLDPKNDSLIQEQAALRTEEDYKNSQLSA
jgi:hypothetical protein